MIWNALDPPPQHPRAPTPGNQFYGPIVYGGKWYQVAEKVQPSLNPADWALRVYSSSNSGATWTRLDSANELSNVDVNTSVYWPGSGATIYFALKRYIGPGRELQLVTFDLATETWGATVTGGPAVAGGYSGVKMVRRSDGSQVILYNSTGLYYVVYNAGWGASVEIDPGPNIYSEQIQLDAADLVHFYYSRFSFPNYLYKHMSLTAAGALSAEQALFSSEAGHAIGVPALGASKLWVPYARQDGADFFPSVMVGTAAGDAEPVWASDNVSATVEIMPPNNSDNAASFAVFKDTDLYVFWATPIPTYGAGEMNSIYYAVYDGASWTAGEWFTDAASNPYQDWFHNPSVAVVGGNFVVEADRIYRDGSNAWSFSGNLAETGGGTPPPPGGGAEELEGNNDATLLLDLSSARQTLKRYRIR